MTSVVDPLAEFFSEQQSWRRPVCSVSAVLDQLPADKADLLRVALDTPTLQHTAISKTLRKWGVHCPPDSIGRHRQKACRCER